jgi:hypothetical protein
MLFAAASFVIGLTFSRAKDPLRFFAAAYPLFVFLRYVNLFTCCRLLSPFSLLMLNMENKYSQLLNVKKLGTISAECAQFAEYSL